MEGTVETPAKEPRLIKRYANRKLYDTQDSRYVTLQQIAEMVRRGEDVKIIDNKSKEDLTNVTLAQIIYEEEKKGDGDARRSSLRSLIEEGQKRLRGSLPGPLSKLLDEKEKEKADAKGVAEEGEAKDKKSPLDDLKGLADDRVKAIVGSAMGTVQHLQGEVRRLQGRIDELESRLATLLGRKAKPEGERSEEE